MGDFWIDTYNASDVKLNPHTQAVSGVRITDRINQIGECHFVVPADVATALGSAKGLRYRLYHSDLGYLGRYAHQDMTMDVDQRTATITAQDSLIDLANAIIGFGKSYVNQTVVQI